jgi:hypothetical protein
LKTASDNAAAAVTAKDGVIAAEVTKIRAERAKIAGLKQKADKKLADMKEAADKDNFDKAKEALYGTANNRASGA